MNLTKLNMICQDGFHVTEVTVYIATGNTRYYKYSGKHLCKVAFYIWFYNSVDEFCVWNSFNKKKQQ